MIPQHLQLGILQEGETGGGGMAMRVLRECSVDCQKLKQQLAVSEEKGAGLT